MRLPWRSAVPDVEELEMDDFGDEEDPILRQFQRELRQSSKAFVHRRPPSKRDQRLLKRLEAQPEFAVVCPEGNRCLVKLLNNPAATKLYFDIDGCRAICGGKELVKLRSLTAAETTRLNKISATMILGALGWAVGGAFVPITGPAVAGKVIGIIVGSGGLSSGALIAKVRRDRTLTRLMEETRRVRKETLRREAMEVRRMEAQQPADDPELLYRVGATTPSDDNDGGRDDNNGGNDDIDGGEDNEHILISTEVHDRLVHLERLVAILQREVEVQGNALALREGGSGGLGDGSSVNAPSDLNSDEPQFVDQLGPPCALLPESQLDPPCGIRGKSLANLSHEQTTTRDLLGVDSIDSIAEIVLNTRPYFSRHSRPHTSYLKRQHSRWSV